MAEPSSPLSSVAPSSPLQAIPTTPTRPRKYTDDELAAEFLGSDDSYRPTPKMDPSKRRALNLKIGATKRLDTIAQQREVRRAESATAYLPPLPALFGFQGESHTQVHICVRIIAYTSTTLRRPECYYKPRIIGCSEP